MERTEVAQWRTGRRARPRCCKQADRGRQSGAAASEPAFCFVAQKKHPESSPTGAVASIQEISAFDRADLPMDRERSLEHDRRQAGDQKARRSGDRLWRTQIGAMAEKTATKMPQATRHGCKEASSLAHLHQAAH